MFVNSVRNFNITSFKAQENEVSQAAEAKPGAQPAPEIPEITKPDAKADSFEHTQPTASQPAQNPGVIPGVQMPTLAQISKAKTTQKILGGSVFALGALGIASALSPKKWVRLLFTIPVGGAIAYFGANMYNMANALDKLKHYAVNPQAKQ